MERFISLHILQNLNGEEIMDSNATFDEIKKLINDFDDERDWHQYHHPKELAISISLESAELLEHFQWVDKQPIESIKSDIKLMEKIRDELADVIVYSLNFANQLDIDVSSAIISKLEKNAKKYPVELAKGKSEKYTEYVEG